MFCILCLTIKNEQFVTRKEIEELNKRSYEFYKNKKLRKQQGLVFKKRTFKKIILKDDVCILEVYWYKNNSTQKIQKYISFSKYAFLYSKRRIDINLIVEHYKLIHILGIRNYDLYAKLNKINFSKSLIFYYSRYFYNCEKHFNTTLKSQSNNGNNIYIDIDDMYFKTRQKNKKVVKIRATVLNIFQLNSKNKRSNISKMVFLYEQASKQPRNIQKIKNEINKHVFKVYSIEKPQIIFLGDRAQIFTKLAKEFNVNYVFDSFHFGKELFKVFGWRKNVNSDNENFQIFSKLGDFKNIYLFLKKFHKQENYLSFCALINEFIDKTKNKIPTEKMIEIKKILKIVSRPNFGCYINGITAASEGNISDIKKRLDIKLKTFSLKTIILKLQIIYSYHKKQPTTILT